MINGILGALAILAAGPARAQDGIRYQHREVRVQTQSPAAPAPSFVMPTTPPAIPYQYQQYRQSQPQYVRPYVAPSSYGSTPYYYTSPVTPPRPYYEDRASAPRQPGYVMEDRRPRRPPEFVDFSDEFKSIVTRFVEAQANKNQGFFVVKDDRDGSYHYLKLSRFFPERITRLSPTEVFGCVEFDGAKDDTGKFDLDFHLSNEDWDWKVSKLLIHKVDGQARFHYNSDHQIVLLNAPGAAAPGAAAETAPEPKAPAQLRAEVAFRSAGGGRVLSGDDRAELSVTVKNSGPGPAYSVRIVPSLQGDVPGLALPAEVSVGDILPKKSASVMVPLTGSAELRSQKARVKLSVNEGNGFDADPVIVEFRTVAAKPPRLEVSGVKLVRGAIRAGEATPLSVTVRNAGSGPAEAVKAALELASPDIFMSGEPAAELGTLKPGQSKTAEFEFFVKKRYRGEGPLPVSVAVSESRGRYGLAAQSLRLALGQEAPAAQVVRVSAAADELEDVDAPPAARTPTDPEAYAVVIGIEKYRDIPAVEFAARDAQTMYDYLTGAMGFSPKNVVHLADERATRTDLATYLGPWLADRVTAKSRVFVYFSGHGSPNPVTGESYLIPYDGNPNYVETKAFALKQLYENLAGLPTKDVTVVLDSCFSGAGGRSFLAAGIRPLVNVKVAAPAENMLVLSAAQGEQISTYYPDTQHGMFTYFLLKGLRGAADHGRDGAVTTKELFEYLRPEVEREARKQHVEQRPAIAPGLEALGERAGKVWLKLK